MTQRLSLCSCLVHSLLVTCLVYGPAANGQTQIIDGKEYTQYKPSYFKPKLRLHYMVYASPIITVDPLDLGGKNAYAISAGTRINLWESRTPPKALAGLKVNGWYIGGGYEYFPQQYDKVYTSLWIRLKTFMQFVGRMDAVYSYGYGLQGIGSRYCAGFEIKKITIMVCGELFAANQPNHPHWKSEYFNQGAVFAIIPLYTRK